jgi:DNA-binding NarL/FixJ family response regulator
MKHPQLLIYEWDSRLANLLRPLADKQRWLLREPRQLSACLRLLRRGGPGILVLRTGRNLERELTTLEQVSWLHPDTATVVVGDSDQAWLGGLAWDLGASYVFLPPQPRDRLVEIISGLMAGRCPEPIEAPRT